ncbi:DUF192 domain-containing protein [Cereibacter sphaeroides]|uniref:DUF192 domain-containing protein n=1 Tax=Cereibacter sphaeroides TaxID=1063 RepID=UPI001F49051B|nr:DUF192 domain-containing protein [Cereibacter sphaeroides]MCE6961439.1 DUF192 domain-containing protein [Cereibacter sphaeroides]MCE6970426.1 DUF192 domain-containing protein [Cereibacter sphaeroides]MCE6973880.1 DUF192 domain-containing protein [Cereibacter sphaeroides]
MLALLPAMASADCRADAVEVRTPGGTAVRFSVELADTPAERAKGLMFRESLPRSAGMLFLFDAPQVASFWMRNTLIPLDMIFVSPDGTVKSVHANAVPGDLTPIRGGEGIQSVLEINGGLAGRLGIVPGSVLRHPALDPSTAAWPCD